MENKHEIVKAFLPVLQMTNFYRDLVNLEYVRTNQILVLEDVEIPIGEWVIGTFENGAKKMANVAMDSGKAMLKDILKQFEN